MNTQHRKRIAVLGYGNPGRQDDGLGPALASAIEALDLPNVTVDEGYQLNIEDAATLAEHDRVLFVDASMGSEEPYEFRRVDAAEIISFSTHAIGPESVLAICEESFSQRPEAWILAIRGYDFELGEGLTPQAEKNLEKALNFVQVQLQGWRI